MDALRLWVAVFAAAVVAALYGVEAGRAAVHRLAKPLATLSLFGVLAPEIGHHGDAFFAAGLALSAAGDVALLFEGERGFMAGVVFFLLAQLAYAAGFMSGGAIGASWTPLVGLLLFGATSAYLVRAILPGAPAPLRLPVLVYAAGITAMLAVALASVAGPWPAAAGAAAAAGAVLFYLSDGNLAWQQFVRPYAHGHTITLSLYWAGQLGLMLGARWSR